MTIPLTSYCQNETSLSPMKGRGMGLLQVFQLRQAASCIQRVYLFNCHTIKADGTFILGQSQLYQFCIHAFHIDKDYKLFESCLVTNISFTVWMTITPHLSCHSKKCNIQYIGFIGVYERLCARRNIFWHQMGLNGICMNTIVDFCKRTVQIPVQRQTAIFVRLQPKVIFNNIQFKLWGNPRCELKSNILMGKGGCISWVSGFTRLVKLELIKNKV